MFIFTAKFNKRKAVAALLLLAAVLIIIVLIAGSGGRAESAASLSAIVKTNAQRVAYLTALGWEVEPEALEEQRVLIPREFSDVYAEYNELQKAQGFDLESYCGLEATRYTYEISNHPDADGRVFADMIVYRGEIIAGDVQSASLDGFMQGLEYPQKSLTPQL